MKTPNDQFSGGLLLHPAGVWSQWMALESPGGLARIASRNAWEMSAHLNLLNDMLRQAVVDAEAGLIDGVTISCPPQHGKSQLCSKYLPAWYLGTRPDRRVILTSYEASFAIGWSRQVRNLLAEQGHLYGLRIAKGAATAANREIAGHSGGMSAAGAGGPITGKGASLLIVDDPVKNDTQARSPLFREHLWEWWQTVASTRLHQGGLFVVVQTRWHREDLTGRIRAWIEKEGLASRWRFLTLPALAEENDPLGRAPGAPLWPDHFSAEHLARMRSGKSPYFWNALYQQSPRGEGMTEWPEEWFRRDNLWFDEWPTAWKAKVIALDPAAGTDATKSDYSAFVMLLVDAEGKFWVDAELRHLDLPELKETAIDLQRQFQPDIFAVEANQFQGWIVGQIVAGSRERGLPFPAHGIVNGPGASKHLRIRRLTPFLGQNAIRFKSGSSGAKLLVSQLRDFPTALHDDGPDALEMAIRVARALIEGRTAENADDYGRVVAW